MSIKIEDLIKAVQTAGETASKAGATLEKLKEEVVKQVEEFGRKINKDSANEPVKGTSKLKTLNDYMESAWRTAPENSSQNDDIKHGIYGLITELGEFTDVIKKRDFYKKEVDRTNLIEELGDSLWYIAILCRGLGITLEEVANININKLKARFPNKFSEDAAKNRDLQKERDILEGKDGCGNNCGCNQ